MAGVKDLADIVAKDLSIPKVHAKEVIDSVFNSVSSLTEDGTALTIKGFGVFKNKTTAARKGRNPQTQQEITIPEKTRLTFKVSK